MTRAASPLRERMIFVVGARRSGTNWLQRTLTAHPHVVGIPSETYLFSHGIAPLAERFQHEAITSARTGFVYMNRDAMLDALRDLCDTVFGGLASRLKPRAQRIVERTPEHVRCLDLIAEIYPDAFFLHIIRDGRDVVRSLLSQDWGPRTVEEAAKEWRTAVEEGRAAGARLERYREVRYEEALADPLGSVASLFEWLGLQPDRDSVEAALMEAGVRYNVDPSAPAVATEKWREGLTASDLAAFDVIAGDTLAGLGYARESVAALPAATSAEPSGASPPEDAAVRARPAGLRARLSSLRSSGGGAFEREALQRTRGSQRVFNRFLAGIVRGRWHEVRAIFGPQVYIRVVSRDGEWEGRGDAAAERLVSELTEDAALRATQVRGDVHPGMSNFVAVLGYLSDGAIAERVVAVAIEGDRIARITWYRLPLPGA